MDAAVKQKPASESIEAGLCKKHWF